MKDIRVKTNGYEITEGHKAIIKKWENFIFENMDVKFIDHFYYGDKLDMATVKLKDEYYGDFNITENRISFTGHTCTHEEYLIFTKATKNDELYNGIL